MYRKATLTAKTKETPRQRELYKQYDFANCHNASKFVLLSICSLLTVIWPKIWVKKRTAQEWIQYTSGWRASLNLSKHVFERCKSTESEAFSRLICLDANKFVLLSFFSLIKTIYPRVLTKPLPNDAKRSLPVEVCHSKTLLLKLPNVFAQAHYWLIWRKENDLRGTIFRRRDWLWKPETSRMKTMLLRFMLDAPCRSLGHAQLLVFFVQTPWLNKLMRCSYWSISTKWWECYWRLCTVDSKKSNRNITKKSNGFHNHFNTLTMKTHSNSNMTITLHIPSQFLPIYPTAHVHS